MSHIIKADVKIKLFAQKTPRLKKGPGRRGRRGRQQEYKENVPKKTKGQVR